MAEEADPIRAFERQREESILAHRVGLPRRFHVSNQKDNPDSEHNNQDTLNHGAAFVFNGMPATNSDIDCMEQQKATWLTSNPRFRRKLLVQERGDIAERRHELEKQSKDRLLSVLRERRIVRTAATKQTRRCHGTLLSSQDRLKLNKVSLQDKLNAEENFVEAARAALNTRSIRKEKRRIEAIHAAAASAEATVGTSQIGTNNVDSFHRGKREISQTSSHRYSYRQDPLDKEKDRAYLRFLKEGTSIDCHIEIS